MNRMLIGAAIVIALALGAMLILQKEAPLAAPGGNGQVQGTDGTGDGLAAETQTIKLYYYNEDKDRDGSGNIQCSAKGLAAVERAIAPTQTPLTEAIELLLEGALTQDEKARGITTEFPLAGVALKSASVADGLATLTFDDPQHKTGGGSCRASILSAQIEATAKQFPTVQEVRLLPEELFQP